MLKQIRVGMYCVSQVPTHVMIGDYINSLKFKDKDAAHGWDTWVGSLLNGAGLYDDFKKRKYPDEERIQQRLAKVFDPRKT